MGDQPRALGTGGGPTCWQITTGYVPSLSHPPSRKIKHVVWLRVLMAWGRWLSGRALAQFTWKPKLGRDSKWHCKQGVPGMTMFPRTQQVLRTPENGSRPLNEAGPGDQGKTHRTPVSGKIRRLPSAPRNPSSFLVPPSHSLPTSRARKSCRVELDAGQWGL